MKTEQDVVLVETMREYEDFFFSKGNFSLSWYITCGFTLKFIKDDPTNNQVCAVFERCV